MKFEKILVSIYQPGSAAILNSIPGLEVIEGLGSDQYFAYKISLAVIAEKMDFGLPQLKVGSIWFTQDNSCLQNCKILSISRRTIKQFKNSCCILHKYLFSNWFQIKLKQINRWLKTLFLFSQKHQQFLRLKIKRNIFEVIKKKYILCSSKKCSCNVVE